MRLKQIKLLLVALTSLALAAACGGSGPKAGDQSTPTLAYKALYEAVKKKDSEGIKKTLSKGTIEMMEGVASMQKKSFNEMIENGLTETTFSPKLPEMRNEKITGEVAILEVKNEKTGAWESLPFAREDGQWKLAIDTYFKGTMSPKGPTNPDNPGQLPSVTPTTQPPTGTGPVNQKPSVKPGEKPGMPTQITPDAAPPPGPPQPAPTMSAKPETKKGIKPPTR